jgi:hypothetical protein
MTETVQRETFITLTEYNRKESLKSIIYNPTTRMKRAN